MRRGGAVESCEIVGAIASAIEGAEGDNYGGVLEPAVALGPPGLAYSTMGRLPSEESVSVNGSVGRIRGNAFGSGAGGPEEEEAYEEAIPPSAGGAPDDEDEDDD